MNVVLLHRFQAAGLRWLFFLVGLMVMSFGIALMIRAELGIAPWEVLHVGLMQQVGFTVGTWSVLTGLVVLVGSSLLLKEWPKLGALVNMILVGVFIDLFLYILPQVHLTSVSWAMMLASVLINGYGIGLYIAPGLGAGPRDSLMLALNLRLGWSVQRVRILLEITVLTVGWLLGGPVFLGTLIYCVGIGYVVGITLPHCKRMVQKMIERGTYYEDINKGTVRINNYDGTSKEIR
ncbi:YczE/YyaS/YitT family protein [Alkalicoccobacillus murimartini]|uniref:Membrane protein YczE n=1 Tax=Alkalicoccobacillus murimartini TaxID=171685 RepID=A0ABT9YD21_9BACI|nr:YitT family protein [Alkalicoccobacillus murimartini]MDQ0205426.1 putative membrane protein YczE [Alkalicoccobacillus murimartini]